MQRLLIAALLLVGIITVAQTQPTTRPCVTGASGCPPVSASNPLPITGSITPLGTQDVNLTQILGAAVSATNPVFVSPATASTPWIVTGSGTAGTAAAGVTTIQGIASMTPVLATGTGAAGTAATGVVTVQGIASMTPLLATGTGAAGTAATGVVTVQGIASMTPLLATGTGTAGTAAAGVVTVQGIASMTPISVSQGAAATGGYSYLNIPAGKATTVVKASAGTLHTITLNSAATAANTTVVYDHASGVGTIIAAPNVVAATVPTTLIFDLAFGTGLTIITATQNGGDMTVTYK